LTFIQSGANMRPLGVGVLKFALVIVFVLTVAAAAVLGYFIYGSYPASSSDTAVYAQALTVLAVLLAIVVSAVVIYALYRLFRWALTGLISGVGLGGLPPLLILVSLTLAATLFSGGAEAVWYVAYGLLRVLFVDFPRSIVDVAFNAYSCGMRSSPDCIVQISANLANSVAQFFITSFRNLGRIIDVLQFFTAWAIFAWLLRDYFTPSREPAATVGPRSFFQHMDPVTRLRLGLTAVVVIGAYLCLCAIVAVSLFKPAEKLQQIEPGRFEKQLDAARLAHDGSDSPFAKRFPEHLPDFPQSTQSTQLQGPYYQQLKSEYDELTVRWGQLRTEIASEQDRLRDIAADNYNIKNLNRVGDREQANYYLALESWYQSSLSNLFSYLERCRTAILLVRIGSAADLTGSSPSSGSATSDSDGAPTPPRSASAFGPAGFSAASNARQVCEAGPPVLADVPDRGDFGYSLGIMGSLSSWLLRTESMPLAVITGLIGFGLFGALVSMFVRTPTDQINEWAVFGVVCRGVSAAIVVFLAAYGGIAIVSQNGGDPNPYVVFVTCLVGAVFSDEVWKWAKERLLPGGEPPRGGAGQQAGAEQQAEGTEQQPAGVEQQARVPSSRPTGTEQQTAGAEQQALVAEQAAGAGDQAAAGAAQQAANASQQTDGENSGRRSSGRRS
jgi:hypothetical protein